GERRRPRPSGDRPGRHVSSRADRGHRGARLLLPDGRSVAMIFHGYYSDVPDAELNRFVDSQELGRLITVGADGTPHVGLYPFVRDGGAVDLHLVQADEQIADLDARGRIIRELREGGRALDGRAADALEWTLSPNGGGTAHVPAPGPPAHRSP